MLNTIKALMGGSGSTGSSLLRIILNRHPDIFSGAELNFFNKEQLFEDWQNNKKYLIASNPSFATKGWVPYPGHNLLHRDYGWSKEEIFFLIKGSTSLSDFVQDFFERPLTNSGASVWVEKTPSNAYSFPLFLKMFPDAKVIHTTRNPYDAVASLVRRGLSTIFSVGMWVYNTSSAMRVSNSERYMLIKYEDFVKNPKEEIARVLEFLGMEVNLSILETNNSQDEGVSINTWNNLPTQGISQSSIGNFFRLDESIQREIITALSLFRISDKHMISKGFTCSNCMEICQMIGYNFDYKVYTKYIHKIWVDIVVDILRRTLHSYPTRWGFYPAKIPLLF